MAATINRKLFCSLPLYDTSSNMKLMKCLDDIGIGDEALKLEQLVLDRIFAKDSTRMFDFASDFV
jgi:hypothetical protein